LIINTLRFYSLTILFFIMKKLFLWCAATLTVATVATAQSQAGGSAKRHPGEPEVVYVQGGTFIMGCTNEQSGCDADESAHSVTLSNFSIGKYEVTQAQWKAVMGGSNPAYFKGDKSPIEQVSWNDIQGFIRKLNAATGKRYRLPTEAEWEYAARGGNATKSYRYSGDDAIGNIAWYEGNSKSTTHPVGTKSPNELGICDMSGNVWEYCSDWYGAYSSTAQTNPPGPANGTVRVLRGGSWGNETARCRVASRTAVRPDDRGSKGGFRLVLP
jgi:formylglycine-generating enzyme required for sulfatase activity